jgi:4a-hydroxytetrahydrobiopterin dehydratase
MTDGISPWQFLEAEGVEDWRVLGEGVCTYFRTGSFAAGARLVHAISELAGLDDHHPDVDVRYEGVTVRLITIADDYYGLSKRDVELARQISAMARKLGVSADPSNVQTVLVSIDALVSPAVMPFWRAVLGYQYIRMISNLVLPLSLSLEGETMRSPDAKEAQRAFLEKRPPTFGTR